MNCHLLHTKGESEDEFMTKSKDRKSNREGATSIFYTKATTVDALLLKINRIENHL